MALSRWTLQEAAEAALAAPSEVLDWGPTLVLAPHPDDEALGCGGAIALLRQAGIAVEIVWLTDGRRSHPNSRSHPPDRLAALRESEARASAAALGVAPEALHFLRLEDACVPDPPDREAVALLRQLSSRAQTILTAWRLDPHCDHRAAFAYLEQAVEGQAVRLMEYPIWLWENGEENDRPLKSEFCVTRLEVAPVLSQKRSAIASHLSQTSPLIEDDPQGFRLSSEMLAHFQQPWELYFTTRPAASLEPAYFETRYAQKLDYWNFETSAYEAAKYAHTLASLPRERYRSAFEIGCSIGVLTAQLAARCDRLLAIDAAEAPLSLARDRCGSWPEVRIEQRQFPRERPTGGPFDLVVLSETAYYWSRPELAQAQRAIEELIEPGGHLVLVHWTPAATDYPLTGDEVHESFLARPGWRLLRAERRDRYRLEVLEREPQHRQPGL